jgi:hypothetical protein
LVEESEEARVGVRCAVEVLLRRWWLDGWIVEEAEGGDAVYEEGGECCCVFVEGGGEKGEERVGEGLEFGVEGGEFCLGWEDGRRWEDVWLGEVD